MIHMKKLISLATLSLFLTLFSNIQAQEIAHITAEEFQKKVFDYKNKTEWDFDGKIPVLIDFYATWCGPCKRVAPILEELQKEYKGKLIIYKVNVDKEKELSGVFAVQSMPTFLFIPTKGKPTMAKGALPKETFKQAFHEIFGL